MRLVVLKLGGSLFHCPDLAARLQGLMSELATNRIVIVVGGGGAADVVRRWSQSYSLSEESAHWIALRSLSVTRALVKTLLPECVEVGSLQEASGYWAHDRGPLLLDLEACLRQAESTDAAPLPHSWDVTSDSIAAWIATRWSADELVLLKSTGLPTGISIAQAARDGLVDRHFPRVCTPIPRICWCNLISNEPRRQVWVDQAEGS
jgi:aspartokinase-like uncharacterized kinase